MFLILFPVSESQRKDTEKCLFENLHAHFALSQYSIGENNWHFLDSEAKLVDGIFHFYLKSIADEFYLIKFYCL